MQPINVFHIWWPSVSKFLPIPIFFGPFERSQNNLPSAVGSRGRFRGYHMVSRLVCSETDKRYGPVATRKHTLEKLLIVQVTSLQLFSDGLQLHNPIRPDNWPRLWKTSAADFASSRILTYER